MEKCHMATSGKVKHSQCLHSRKELSILLQTSPLAWGPGDAGPASPGRESLYPEHEFQEGSVRGRWDHDLPSLLPPKGELEQLQYKLRAPRTTAERKLGGKVWSAPTCHWSPSAGMLKAGGSHHPRDMAGMALHRREGAVPQSLLTRGQLQLLSSDLASLGYLGVSPIHPASSLPIGEWQKQK